MLLQPLPSLFKAYLFDDVSDIADHIQSTDAYSHPTRLNVYRFGYAARLRDVLAADYAILYQLIGHDAFEVIANHYIAAHPSQHPSLRFAGKDFANYIQQEPLVQQSPILAELARLEWAFVDAFDAEDSPAIAPEVIHTIPAENWPDVHFEFHPSVIFLPLSWNAVDLWTSIKEEGRTIPFEQLPAPAACIVWRQDLAVQYRLLSPSETAFFVQAQQGATFATLCETLLEWYTPEETVNQAAQFIMQWVHAGLIRAILY